MGLYPNGASRPSLLAPGDLTPNGRGYGTVDEITPGFALGTQMVQAAQAAGATYTPASQSPFGIPHLDFGNAGLGLIALLAGVWYARRHLL